MPPIALSEDEFRVLAYIRAYADNCAQHLDPGWVQAQLNLSSAQMLEASRNLAALGLATIFEWTPDDYVLRLEPGIRAGPRLTDIRLTERGWDYLRRSPVDVGEET